MSRRKQANPRPLKVTEERVGQEEDAKDEGPNDEKELFEEDPSLAPLVIDVDANKTNTKSLDDVSSSSLELSTQESLSQAVTDQVTSDQFEDMGSYPPSEAGSSRVPSPTTPSSLHNSINLSDSSFSKHKRGKKILPVEQGDGVSKYVCPVCQQEMRNLHDLTVHIRSHNNSTGPSTQANSCTICGKTLSSQSSLDRHMLVHSGERPFRCKMCSMSFTTNGNMHRHMRIHNKDSELGLPAGMRPVARRGRGGGMRSKTRDVSEESNSLSFLSPLSVRTDLNPSGDVDADNVPLAALKRQISTGEVSNEFESPSKKRFNDSSFQHMRSPSYTRNFDDEKVASKESIQSVNTEPSENGLKEGDQLHCPVCNKGFLCKLGLESHLETHVDVSPFCHTCQLQFDSKRDLVLHRLITHSKARMETDACDSQLNDSITVGFQDLDFVDFSVEKFPLIAKSVCEKSARRSSSIYHNFVCKKCGRAFPSKSALLLHDSTHSPTHMKICPLCDCDFFSHDLMLIHMSRHVSDKALNDVLHTSSSEDSVNPDCLSQQDFMAMFELTPKQDNKDKEGEKALVEKVDKRQNDDYFAKLGQVHLPQFPQICYQPGSNFSKSDQSSEFTRIAQVMQMGPSSIFKLHPSFLPANLSRALLSSPISSRCQPLLAQYPFAAVSNPSALEHCLPSPSISNTLHAQSLSTSPTSSPVSGDSSSSPHPGDHVHEVKSKGMYPCKYCGMIFPNFRALKGHTRTHLGLSPYKCNLCSYSSADKSTLIRHLRTHNGERPFQCLVCDFAFTTKANCERHVKKKHGKFQKDDIEKAIGYNKFVMDSSKNMDSFHSPDTVCKYCGIDFKFFRALKHHLRSHSSCRLKPFLCRRCHIGFSTKANCVRHLQKQHPEVSQYHIENFIQVNEPSLLDDMDNSFQSSEGSGQTTPDHPTSYTPHSESSTPPTAHSTPVATPVSFLMQDIHVAVKTEVMDGINEKPIDFSLKRFPCIEDTKPTLLPEECSQSKGEQPMDLSVKKSPASTSDESVQNSEVLPNVQHFQCQYCPRFFTSATLRQSHECKHLQSDPRGDNSTSDNNNNEKSLLASVYNPQSSTMVPIMSPVKYIHNKGVYEAQSSSSPKLAFVPMKLKTSPHQEQGKQLNYGSDSSSDLASVNKILDATDAQNFQALFQLPNDTEDECDMGSDEEDYSNESDFDDTGSHPSIQNSNVEDSQDSAMMKEGVSSDAVSTNHTASVSQLEDSATQVQQSKMLTESSNNGESLSESQDQVSDLMELKKDFVTPVKKKRNSYADSPHKLSCPYCPRSFPWVSSLNRHLLTHTGQKPFKCPRCPVTFSTKSNRERHLIRKHGVNMLDPASRQTMDRPYKCHLCVFSSFSTEGNLLKHYKERHNGCSPPDLVYNRGDKSLASEGDSLEENSCDQIQNLDGDDDSDNEESMSSDKMKEKMTEKDVIDAEAIEPEMSQVDDDGDCDDDDMSVVASETGKVVCGSAERQINPERDNYNVDKITNCWKCSERFQSRKLLVRHLKEHNIDLPFKCYLCDASYDVRKECLLHQERQHAGDWAILKEKNRVDNIDTFSKKMEKIVEQNCKNSQLQMTEEQVDISVTGEDGQQDIVTSDYLQRKVYCSLCPKRFWSLQDLRRHMRSHTGERPFECDKCQKRFTLKHSMMRHRKKHQGNASPSVSDDEDSLQGDETGGKISTSAVSGRNALRHRLLATKLGGDGDNGIKLSNKSTGNISEKDSTDILHNLLGVEMTTIDRMLDSAASAAELLGVG